LKNGLNGIVNKKMSGNNTTSKPFMITPESFESGKIKFGEIESKKDIPGAKGSRAAVGYEGMAKSSMTCIPGAGEKRRSAEKSLVVVFTDMFSVGLLPQYPYTEPGQPQKPRTPENVSGFNLMVPLVSRESAGNPSEKEAKNLAVLKAFHKAAQKFVLTNKEKLPAAFRHLSDEKLKACIQPIETPTMTRKKDGKDVTYPPTLYGKVVYWPLVKAGTGTNKTDKDRPENFSTVFRNPRTKDKYTAAEIKAFQKCPGKTTFALRINHLNFWVGGGEENELKIKFDTELAEVVYVKNVKQDTDLLSSYCTDMTTEDDEGLISSFSKSVDPTVSYGDAPGKYGEESDSSEDAVKEKKSSSSKKKAKASSSDDDEEVKEVVPKKKQRATEEDVEEKPVKKSSKSVVEDTDEEQPTKKKSKK